MPYQDAVGDIVRLTSAVTYADEQTEEVNLHLRCLQTGGIDSRPAIAGWADSLWIARFAAHIPPSASYYGSHVALVKSLLPYSPVVTYANTAGTGTGNGLPTQCRWLLHWKTDFAGVKYRGRMFGFTPMNTDMAADGRVSSAFITAMLSLADTFMAGFSGGGALWKLTLAHRPKPPATIWTDDLITGRSMSGEFATQRRSGALGRVNPPPW